MATTNTKKPRRWRPLIGLLAVVLVLLGSIFAGNKWSDATWTPKLALDLEGGTQIILQAVTSNNESVSSEEINQAIEIIRQRVDSSGVSEAEITSQGGQNIVVALPGHPSQETLDLVRESAQMQFRPVLYYGSPAATPDASATNTPDSSADTSTDAASDSATDGASADATDSANAADTASDSASAEPAPSPTNASDFVQVTADVLKKFNALDCTVAENRKGGGGIADPEVVQVACADDGSAKYVLGPMEIAGSEIKNAQSGMGTNAQGISTGQWVVNIEFNKSGTNKFSEVTRRLAELPDLSTWMLTQPPTQAPNMFAMVLDNLVISAPSVTKEIPTGKAEISGNFTNESANRLASQLNFGALPLTFEVQSEETISATLGSEQLEKGLLAGLIGLVLVIIYSLFQYRALGFVTVASLAVAAVLTYLAIVFLSWQQGYRLSLPGVAGVIVAIGITADSFIVYFERIRDELRDGRNLEGAIDVGWDRARRTILASDAINFLAAVVLYFLAVGGVRGFAFTLGLTTLIDLVVVFLFTHPVMRLIARWKFFAHGHRMSGFHHASLGIDKPHYVGRGRVSTPRAAVQFNEDGTRMTIAQRKAAELAATKQAQSEDNSTATLESSPETAIADQVTSRAKDGDN